MTGEQVTGEIAFEFANWAQDLAPSPLQRALARADDPEVVSLTLGLPDPLLFPVAELCTAADRVLSSNRMALQYSLPCCRLREGICDLMKQRGVKCCPEDVFLTAGAQQGISLLVQLLLTPGGSIIEERFCYTGFQQALVPLAPRVISIATDAVTGIHLDDLEAALTSQARPKLIYVMADGHNPLGATMPIKHRERLAALARRYEVPLLEDDPYGWLEYDDAPYPPIRAFSRDWVCYIGSFSKLLAPSLRVGWIIAPPPIVQRLATLKESSDINTGTFSQWVVAEFLMMGMLPSHLARLRDSYRSRRVAMTEGLQTHFPEYCRWTIPKSGVFVWVELPARIDATALLNAALARRVAFIPSEAFSRGQRRNAMRLNFSRYEPSTITQAMRRLATVIDRA